MAPDEIENNGGTHGYAWSDGTVHDHPEPKVTYRAVVDERTGAGHAVPTHNITLAMYAKAYADWLKEYTAWKADMATWRERNAKK